MKKNKDKKIPHNENEDIVFEEEGETELQAIKKIRENLKKCISEKQEYLEGWQRAKADLINYKREEGNRLEAARETVKEKIIREILPALDSFTAALDSTAWHEASEEWKSGMENTFSLFKNVLSGYGVEEIKELDFFNPEFHESVEMIPTENEKEDGKIDSVIQKGYKLAGQVIRPAKVRVKIYKNN